MLHQETRIKPNLAEKYRVSEELFSMEKKGDMYLDFDVIGHLSDENICAFSGGQFSYVMNNAHPERNRI